MLEGHGWDSRLQTTWVTLSTRSLMGTLYMGSLQKDHTTKCLVFDLGSLLWMDRQLILSGRPWVMNGWTTSTRLHTSRMRTSRLLTVFQHALCRGVSACGCLPRGVSTGGTCLPRPPLWTEERPCDTRTCRGITLIHWARLSLMPRSRPSGRLINIHVSLI